MKADLPTARDEDSGLLVAFESTHAALAAQKLLAGLDAMTVPTPRAITASCGMSLLAGPREAAEARRRIEGASGIASLCAFYAAEGGSFRRLD